MTIILKKCIKCGKEFLTLWDKTCETCQMKKPKVWEGSNDGKS